MTPRAIAKALCVLMVVAIGAMCTAAWIDSQAEGIARSATRDIFELCIKRSVNFEGRHIRCIDKDPGTTQG